MTIIETYKVMTFSYDYRGEERKSSFTIKFPEQDDVYTPYLTNSKKSIGLFIDPIEYAELIQDHGVRYVITHNAILFENEEGAALAADILVEQVRKTPIHKVEELLYDFAKSHYFGRKIWFAEQLRQPNQCEGSDVPSIIIKTAFRIYTSIRENNAYATVYGGNEDKRYRVTFINLATGELETDENRTVHIRDAKFDFELETDLGSWYNPDAVCTN